MGYFANGTEVMDYEQKYCCNCEHGRGSGCAIMDLHFNFGHELTNKKDHAGKIMLDTLIPVEQNGFSGKCSMFIKIQ